MHSPADGFFAIGVSCNLWVIVVLLILLSQRDIIKEKPRSGNIRHKTSSCSDYWFFFFRISSGASDKKELFWKIRKDML
jgi:hypothetical protein